jgi:hypothetical protein
MHEPLSSQHDRSVRGSGTAAPHDWRRALWLALLVVASVAFSLGFACAMPFAAVGAAAALTLARRDAWLLAGAAWLANQIVGFAILGYPWTINSVAWSVVLGVAAVLTALTAQWCIRRLEGSGVIVVSLLSFLGAFIVYEGGLFVVAATLLGGTEAFAPAIVIRIFEINIAAFAGLLVLSRLGIAVGLTGRPMVLQWAGEQRV